MKKHQLLPHPGTLNDWEDVAIPRKDHDVELICEAFRELHKSNFDDPNFMVPGYLLNRHFTSYPVTKEDLLKILDQSSRIIPEFKQNMKFRLAQEGASMFIREVLINHSTIVLFCEHVKGMEILEPFKSFFDKGLQIVPLEMLKLYESLIEKPHYYEIK